MSYEELVENVRKATRNFKVSRAVGHVAFQFNVEGEAEGLRKEDVWYKDSVG